MKSPRSAVIVPPSFYKKTFIVFRIKKILSLPPFLK